jgi:hypothetical protein
MGNQPTANLARAIPQPSLLRAFPEFDDDDDDADGDDDDDEIVAGPRQERWSSRAGFGSPEWWSL